MGVHLNKCSGGEDKFVFVGRSVFIVTCVGCCVGDNILKLLLIAIAGDVVTSNVHLTIVSIVAVL